MDNPETEPEPETAKLDEEALNRTETGTGEQNGINSTETAAYKNINNAAGTKNRFTKVQDPCFQKPVFFDSASKENVILEANKTDPNNTDTNNTEVSCTIHTNPNHRVHNRKPYTIQTEKKDRMMERAEAYTDIIKKNIEYDFFMEYGTDQDLYNELFEIIREVVCVDRETIKVGGNVYPYNLVKSRFLKLDSLHLGYVIRCMKNTSTKIKNIKAYLITALYNATCTINHYYQQEVQHDMYNACCQ